MHHDMGHLVQGLIESKGVMSSISACGSPSIFCDARVEGGPCLPLWLSEQCACMPAIAALSELSSWLPSCVWHNHRLSAG